MIIVLEVSGKGEDIWRVKVITHPALKDAQIYCEQNSHGGKYWQLCKVVEDGVTYDVDRENINKSRI